jgi:hypothetical protein
MTKKTKVHIRVYFRKGGEILMAIFVKEYYGFCGRPTTPLGTPMQESGQAAEAAVAHGMTWPRAGGRTE